MISLIIPVLGRPEGLPITEEYAEKIRESHKIISAIYNIEMKFDLLKGNYFDLQKDFLDKALIHSLYQGTVFDHLSKDERDLTRKFFNFLSTAKLYIDQISRILEDIDKNISNKIKNLIETKRKNEASENFTIRLMIALRNHMQHYDFSTGIYEGSDPVILDDNDVINFHHAGITLNIEKLLQNNSMKGQIPELFQVQEKQIDLTEQTQLFFSELCLIHQLIRNDIKEIQHNNQSFLESVFEEYSQKKNYKFNNFQKILAISVEDSDEEKRNKSDIYIFTTNGIKLIKELQEQNNNLSNILKQVATNATQIQMAPIQENCKFLNRLEKTFPNTNQTD